jgi:hypothetical protein
MNEDGPAMDMIAFSTTPSTLFQKASPETSHALFRLDLVMLALTGLLTWS